MIAKSSAIAPPKAALPPEQRRLIAAEAAVKAAEASLLEAKREHGVAVAIVLGLRASDREQLAEQGRKADEVAKRKLLDEELKKDPAAARNRIESLRRNALHLEEKLPHLSERAVEMRGEARRLEQLCGVST